MCKCSLICSEEQTESIWEQDTKTISAPNRDEMEGSERKLCTEELHNL
jgi:hypothetical protein